MTPYDKKIEKLKPIKDLTKFLTIAYQKPEVKCYKTREPKHYWCVSPYPKPEGNLWNRVDGFFYKSSHYIPEYDGGVFIQNSTIDFIDYEYEVLIDSKGNKHQVQVGYSTYKIAAEDSLFSVDDDFKCLRSELRNVSYCRVQFNLKKYLIVILNPYILDSRTLMQHISSLTNNCPRYVFGSHYFINDTYEKTGYYPLIEHLIDGERYENYIPDSLFFKMPDRRKAIDRLKYNREMLLNAGVLDMNDQQLTRFIAERFKKRIECENILIKHRLY